MSLNVFTATGNIGKDAETRFTANQKAVTSFSLAVTTGWGDNQKTMWVRCNGWGDRFTKLSEYLLKGSKVGVVGELSLNEWTDDGGEKRTSLECNLRDVDLPPRPKLESAGGGFRDTPDPDLVDQNSPEDPGFAEDDIPF